MNTELRKFSVYNGASVGSARTSTGLNLTQMISMVVSTKEARRLALVDMFHSML